MEIGGWAPFQRGFLELDPYEQTIAIAVINKAADRRDRRDQSFVDIAIEVVRGLVRALTPRPR